MEIERIIIYCVLVPLICSMATVFWVFPNVLKIALMKNITDNPNARKLQERPIPVLGGIAVFCGLMVGAGVTAVVFESNALAPFYIAMSFMLYLGTMDDILGLSPVLRIAVEIATVAFVMYMGHNYIDNLAGFCGINSLPVWFGVILSIIAGVGIINAVNMIDGVDGLSTGFCIMACTLFGFAFYTSGYYKMTVLTVLGVGSVLPFFLHNVFGKKTKMFIGDGGTMLMGILMVECAFNIIGTNSKVTVNYTNMNAVAFSLAVLAVPVFDTLRVMTARMVKGRSPFKPDRTHLHHLFIDLGFSHVTTSILILFINFSIVLVWLAAYALGADNTLQLLIVLLCGVLLISCYYSVRHLKADSFIMVGIKRFTNSHNIGNSRAFLAIQRWIDRV